VQDFGRKIRPGRRDVTGTSHPKRSVMVFFVVLVAGIACRSKLDVETKTGAPLPEVAKAQTDTGGGSNPGPGSIKPKAIEQMAKVSGQGGRIYFQSRDTVTLVIDRSLLGDASSFSVYNVTGLAQDQEDLGPLVIKDHPIPAQLSLTTTADQGYLTRSQGKDYVVVTLFSVDSVARKALQFGVNKLKVVANEDAQMQFTYVNIVIRDFTLFAPTTMGFQRHVQLATTADPSLGRFEGWGTVVGAPVVTEPSEQRQLTTGFFDMLRSME